MTEQSISGQSFLSPHEPGPRLGARLVRPAKARPPGPIVYPGVENHFYSKSTKDGFDDQYTHDVRAYIVAGRSFEGDNNNYDHRQLTLVTFQDDNWPSSKKFMLKKHVTGQDDNQWIMAASKANTGSTWWVYADGNHNDGTVVDATWRLAVITESFADPSTLDYDDILALSRRYVYRFWMESRIWPDDDETHRAKQLYSGMAVNVYLTSTDADVYGILLYHYDDNFADGNGNQRCYGYTEQLRDLQVLFI